MEAPSKLATFAIDAQVGVARVVVNDQDISSGTQAFRVEMSLDDQIPVLTIQRLATAGAIEGRGIVQVVDGSTPAQAVTSFLDDLDPAEVERRALDGHDMSRSLTVAIIDAIAEIAGEQ